MRLHTFILLFIIAAGLSISSPTIAEAQTSYTFDDNQSTIHIYGSSNARDWDASVETQNVEITIEEASNPSDNWIHSFRFDMPVSDMDSGSRRLNNNMHDYLKQDDHPNISFELSEILNINESGSDYNVTVAGLLTVAGVEREIELDAAAEINGDGSIRFEGEYDTQMTEFDIDPPTAMMGTVRAEDDVNITFDVTLVQQ